MSLSHHTSESENVDEVKYTYPDSSSSTEYFRNLSDGTGIKDVVGENANGRSSNRRPISRTPDGSYDKSSTTIRYQDNGTRFVSGVGGIVG